MRDFTNIQLRDVVSRVAVRNTAGNTNVLTISAVHGLVSQEKFFNRRVASEDLSQYYLLRDGDFAYNKSYSEGWPAGVVRRLERYAAGVVSPLYICFRPNCDVVDPSYLQHYFNSGVLNDDILRIAKEGVRNHGLLNVQVEDFFDLSLNLPPLAEQRRITDILDEVDVHIDATKDVLEKSDNIWRGSARRLFRDGVLSNRELKQSEVGEIPNSWSVARISEICEVGSGTTPYRAERDLYYSPSGTPWVKTLDLNEGILKSTEEHVTGAALYNFRMHVYPARTVMVAMYGGWAQIGRTACLGVPAAVNQAVCALEVKDEAQVFPEYLMFALQQGRRRWRRVGASTRKDANITKGDVEDFLVPIPGFVEQERIAEIMLDLSRQVRKNASLLQRLALFKNSLMSELLTGKVRGPADSIA
jgi:type I restriction enzyme S subunit